MCRLFFCCGLLAAFFGCGNQEGKSLPPCPVTLNPNEIQLGELSQSSEVAEFSFEIANSSQEPVRTHLQPGCGCTVIEQADFVITGGGRRRVPVTFSLRGRTGHQENVIHVSCRQGDHEWPIEIVVKAEILNEWSSSPLRVVVPPNGRATVTVNSTIAEWNNVESTAIGDGFVFHELNSIGADARQYRIIANDSVDPTRNRGIGFRRTGSDHPFFVVPIVIR